LGRKAAVKKGGIVGGEVADGIARGGEYRAPTLSDVARAAGVSPMTVSKVLRNTGSISTATQARVRQAAEQLGYVPNTLAGALSSQTSRMVGVVIPSLKDAVFAEVLSGIAGVLRPRGFHTFIGESSFDPAIEEDLLRTMLSIQPAGLILTGGIPRGPALPQLIALRGCPAVQIWDAEDPAFALSIGPSHQEAGALVADHFRLRGLRRIGYVGAELSLDLCAARRFRGFSEALATAGITAAAELDDDLPRQGEAGRLLTERLLARNSDLQAIYFLNDAMALGGLQYLHSAGIDVPAQIAVAGFNGTALQQTVRTRLTTVDVPRREIGAAAARALLARIDGETLTPLWQPGLQLLVGNTS
jgi:LacI family transcriptional regulator, gluconate utilization system Gnt-I transcriptional repressor